MLKFLVIGAGWYGCHLASVLLERQHSVSILDSGSGFLNGASMNNQLRLHKGFHYLRSHRTRIESRDGFNLFQKKYPDFHLDVKSNIYAVPENLSYLDIETIFEIATASKMDFRLLSGDGHPWLRNVQGAFITDEKLINVFAAREYFKKRLESITKFGQKVFPDELEEMSKDYDFIIDTTYSSEFVKSDDVVFEATLLGQYRPNNFSPDFEALTLIDGPFWSIFPTLDPGYRSLSHVSLSPLFQSSSEREVEEFIQDALPDSHTDVLNSMAENVIQFVPSRASALESLEVRFVQKKIKTKNNSASREVEVELNGQFIYVRPGKIDAIFSAETRLIELLGLKQN